MEDVEHGELFSATQVRMTGNVHIKSGCNVHIAIKDVPCKSVSCNVQLSNQHHQAKMMECKTYRT